MSQHDIAVYQDVSQYPVEAVCAKWQLQQAVGMRQSLRLCLDYPLVPAEDLIRLCTIHLKTTVRLIRRLPQLNNITVVENMPNFEIDPRVRIEGWGNADVS